MSSKRVSRAAWMVVATWPLLWGCSSNSAVDDDDDTGAAGQRGGGQGGQNQGQAGAGGATDSPVGGGGGGGGAMGGSAGTMASTGGSGGEPPPQQVACDNLPKLKLTRLARSQTSAMALTQAVGDDRIFVVERSGVIRLLNGNSLSSTPFLDIRSSIAPHQRGERGLHNMALHPDFKDNGRFFLFYTRRGNDPMSDGNEGDIVIAEGKAMNATTAAPQIEPLLVIPHNEDDGHNGGVLGFGKDGYLYAGTGDGGGGYDNFGHGQNKSSGLSKILRIDVDNPTEPPPGNMGGGAYAYAFAWGTRNPYKGGFDRKTGDLYFGDVGESSWEEISVLPAGSQAGINFGWGNPGMEGNQCFPWFDPDPCSPTGEMPIFDYFHDGDGVQTDPASYMGKGRACSGGTDADCSRAIVGGYVYRGKKLPDYDGRFFYGDHVKNTIFSLINADGKAECVKEHTEDLKQGNMQVQGLTAFGEDADGELYVLDLFGNIFRIDPE